MSVEARRRAERCFALARSSTFPAERATAIERGEAIATAAGLSLDSFDIPGRTKTRSFPLYGDAERVDLFGSRSTFEEVFRHFEEAIRRATTSSSRYRADAAAYEAELDAAMRRQSDAIRREQDRRAAEAMRGDPNRSGPAMNALRCDEAIKYLWTASVRVYQAAKAPDGSRVFVIPDESDLEYDEEGIIEVAKRHGWERARKINTIAGRAEMFLRLRGMRPEQLFRMTDAAVLATARGVGFDE